MKRVRLLSALLACLAAVATGAPAFASAAVGMPSSATVSGPPSHCSGCVDFGSDRCAKMVDCTAPCAASIPVLAVASFGLERVEVGGRVWQSYPPALTGEHPPPEPLPPRP